MPCQSDYPDDALVITRIQLERVTRVACELASAIKQYHGLTGVSYPLSRETAKWIAEHEAADARRHAEEKAEQERKTAKKNALKKLTSKERKLLRLE